MITTCISRAKKWHQQRPCANSFPTSHLETWSERCRRKNALLIIYIKTLVYFSVVAMVMPPTWPYLQSIDPSASKTLVGWIIIGVPALRPINALLVGWILRHLSIRLVTIVSGLFVMMSCAMWSTAYEAPVYGGYWLLFSRFVIGFFGAEFQIGTTHIATATTQQERSTSMTILAGCLSMAYMMAPGIMSALSYIGPEGILLGSYRLNMYTIAGWLGFLVYGVSLILFLMFYEENDIAVREDNANQAGGKHSEEKETSNKQPDHTSSSGKIDYLALAMCNIIAAHCYGWLQLPDTMMTPMLMDLFAWDEQTAVRRSGNLLTIYGLLALIGFVTTGNLAKRFPERIMMMAGNVAYLVAALIMFPIGTQESPIYYETLSTTLSSVPLTGNQSINAPTTALVESGNRHGFLPSSGGHSYLKYLVIDGNRRHNTMAYNMRTASGMNSSLVERPQVGCPVEMQPWCAYEPRPELLQLILSFGMTMVATPFVLPMVNSAVSKLLPPGSHSFIWGVVNGSANIGRLIYPLLNIYLYTFYGPRVQYGTMILFCLIIVILQMFIYRRLVAKVPSTEKNELEMRKTSHQNYGATEKHSE